MATFSLNNHLNVNIHNQRQKGEQGFLHTTFIDSLYLIFHQESSLTIRLINIYEIIRKLFLFKHHGHDIKITKILAVGKLNVVYSLAYQLQHSKDFLQVIFDWLPFLKNFHMNLSSL